MNIILKTILKGSIFIILSFLFFTSCNKHIDPGNWNVHWPIIDFSYTPAVALIGDTVFLQAIEKKGSSNITDWEWTIKDSSTVLETLEGQNPKFSFENPGTYKIDLLAKDSMGYTGFISKDVTILRDTGIKIRVMVACAKPSGGGYSYDSATYKYLAEIIDQYKPDLLLLRQVDSSTTRNGKINVPQLVAQKVGMEYLYGKAFDYRGGGYGNAVLSRYPIIESSSVVLLPDAAHSGREHRSLPIIKVQLNDKNNHQLVFAGTELESSYEETRLFQANTIISHIGSLPNPVIFASDLNEHEGGQTFSLLQQSFTLACPSNGCPLNNPASSPSKTYDYIFYGPSTDFVLINTFTVPKTINSHYLPLVADFRYNPLD